jgi:tRNA threonylcarbamoyladenosine biosynthesis protein TsaE
VEITSVTHSAAETEAVAGALAGGLTTGDVVLVRGELGAGKTTFVRGACRSLGIEEPVTSPTFTIGHRYRGAVDVSHLDLYRFVGLSPAEWGDLEPYFDDAIAFVEWPEAGAATLPKAVAIVTLEHRAPQERALSITSDDETLLQALAAHDHPRIRHRD